MSEQNETEGTRTPYRDGYRDGFEDGRRRRPNFQTVDWSAWGRALLEAQSRPVGEADPTTHIRVKGRDTTLGELVGSLDRAEGAEREVRRLRDMLRNLVRETGEREQARSGEAKRLRDEIQRLLKHDTDAVPKLHAEVQRLKGELVEAEDEMRNLRALVDRHNRVRHTRMTETKRSLLPNDVPGSVIMPFAYEIDRIRVDVGGRAFSLDGLVSAYQGAIARSEADADRAEAAEGEVRRLSGELKKTKDRALDAEERHRSLKDLIDRKVWSDDPITTTAIAPGAGILLAPQSYNKDKITIGIDGTSYHLEELLGERQRLMQKVIDQEGRIKYLEKDQDITP